MHTSVLYCILLFYYFLCTGCNPSNWWCDPLLGWDLKMENTSLFCPILVIYQLPGPLPVSVWMSLTAKQPLSFFTLATKSFLTWSSRLLSSRQWGTGERVELAGSHVPAPFLALSAWASGCIWVCFPTWRTGLPAAPWCCSVSRLTTAHAPLCPGCGAPCWLQQAKPDIVLALLVRYRLPGEAHLSVNSHMYISNLKLQLKFWERNLYGLWVEKQLILEGQE